MPGKALTLDEADGVAGRPGRGTRAPDGARGRPARPGHGEVGHLLAQGVHPAHHAVPRPLPLLHVREAAGQARYARSSRRKRSSSIAEAGRRMGCKEALFTLGDRPEERYDVARAWLEERGYASTLDYVRAVAIRVIEETGLLPHLNPGVMSYEEMARLKHVSASMGMMLETTLRSAWPSAAVPHFGSPDKVPAVRLRTIEDAGRLGDPVHDRHPGGHRRDAIASAPSRCSRSATLHRRYRHVQEVIVQNFRAKPGTAMQAAPEPQDEEFLAAVATARVVLGPHMSVQAPPNLVGPGPAAPPPRRRDRRLGRRLARSRPTTSTRRSRGRRSRRWPPRRPTGANAPGAPHDLPGVRRRARSLPRRRRCGLPVEALLGADGLAVEGQRPEPIAWQDPDVQWKPRTIELTFAKAAGRRSPRGRGCRSTATSRPSKPPARGRDGEIHPERLDLEIEAALSRPPKPIDRLTDEHALALFRAEGPALDALCRVADDLRSEAVGDEVTYVINRNINFTNVCYVGCRFCAFAQREVDAESYTLTLDRGGRSRGGGVGVRCHRGVHAGRDPPRPARLVLLRPARRGARRARRTCTSTRSVPWRSSTAPRSSGISFRRVPQRGRSVTAWGRSRGPRPRSWTTTCAGC